MTACEFRAFLDRLDEIRSRWIQRATVLLMLGTLIVAAIRWPAQVAHELGLDSLLGVAVDLLALGVVVVFFVSGWVRRGK